MTMSLLGFPPALLGAAIECEAVATLAGKNLQMEQTPDVSQLSLGRSLQKFDSLWLINDHMAAKMLNQCPEWAVAGVYILPKN